MKILLSNDDGYTAKGINELVKVLVPLGEVTVVAPKNHQSGASAGLKLGPAIAVKDLGMRDGARWYYVDGTPATCIKYALEAIFPDEKPDVVVSGINHGSNAATAMWYSGTVGAAREAAIYGVKAVAVSLDSSDKDADFSAVTRMFPAILGTLLENWPEGSCPVYNVNFPKVAEEDIKGIIATRMGNVLWYNQFLTADQLGLEDPQGEEGESFVYMRGEADERLEDIREDNCGLHEGYVTITPQSMENTDMTEYKRLLKLGF